MRQWLIAIWVAVNIGESAVGFGAVFVVMSDFLHQVRTVPDKFAV
ncbi:hypothetical protein [Rodentibacter pneumotropicus]|nr:hypothetical protein [Rodentibacter pneumotropicus]